MSRFRIGREAVELEKAGVLEDGFAGNEIVDDIAHGDTKAACDHDDELKILLDARPASAIG